MRDYNDLLQEAKLKVEGLRGTIRSTAAEFIPKMYHALKAENPEISPEDVRRRIEWDCNGIWSRRTILEALPDEAKNPVKQKAGQLGQKGLKSAAFSAAQLGHGSSYNGPPQTRTGKPWDLQIKECESCQELLSENRDLKEALTKATVLTSAEEIAQQASDKKEPIFRFEFHIPSEDVRRYIATPNTDGCWFNVTIDIKTGKVVTATVGRSSELEANGGVCCRT
jgi:hypothetical protein